MTFWITITSRSTHFSRRGRRNWSEKLNLFWTSWRGTMFSSESLLETRFMFCFFKTPNLLAVLMQPDKCMKTLSWLWPNNYIPEVNALVNRLEEGHCELNGFSNLLPPSVFPIILSSHRLVIDFLSENVTKHFRLVVVYRSCICLWHEFFPLFAYISVCLMLSAIIAADHKLYYQLLLSVFEPLS